jgi:hypothetical protein
MRDLAILDMSFDRGSVRPMKLEVRCPVTWPGRQQLNAPPNPLLDGQVRIKIFGKILSRGKAEIKLRKKEDEKQSHRIRSRDLQ